jgi:peptidoglycan/xylan/chitin deacetylase (PgdA/CDA1 family)
MLIKQIAVSAIKKSGMYSLLSPWYCGYGTILMFHRICDSGEKSSLKANSSLEITPDYLEEIIGFFAKKGYEFVPIGDVPGIMNAKRPKKKFVVFTFDDGYIDNYTIAYPIFRKYQIPFTVYVTTSFPDGTAILWWYMLEKLIPNHEIIEFDLNGKKIKLHCKNNQERESAFISIRDIIMGGDTENYLSLISSIFNNYGIDPRDPVRRMAVSWDMIQEMARDPLVTIGAHTVNHIALTNLSEKDMLEELMLSKSKIESVTGIPVKAISYPFGGPNEAGQREFDAAQSLGYTTGTTTIVENVFKQHKNCLTALPRWNVDGNLQNIHEIEYLSGCRPYVQSKSRLLNKK